MPTDMPTAEPTAEPTATPTAKPNAKPNASHPRILKGMPIPIRRGGRPPSAYIRALAKLQPGECFPLPAEHPGLRSSLYDYARRHGLAITIRRDDADRFHCWRLAAGADDLQPETVPDNVPE